MKPISMKAAVTALMIAVTAMFWPPLGQAGSRYGANYFPNVTLTTQDGKQVKFYDDLIKGKIVAIDLIYTQCKDACPLETARLRQVQKLLSDRVGKDIFFYSISIDPEHDTPAVLHDYAEMYNAGPGWLFLTGKKEDIEALSKKLGLYSDPDLRNRDGHTPALLIGNEPAGQWIRNSATDNPHFLATQIGDFIDNWANLKPVQPQQSSTQAQITKLDPGQYLFATHCVACHSVGQGDKIGPDLAGITEKRSHAWLARFIAEPDKLVDAKDPTALALFERYKRVRMPNLRLASADVEILIDFLQKQSGDAKGGNTVIKNSEAPSAAKQTVARKNQK
jgi:protein SCO1/2